MKIVSIDSLKELELIYSCKSINFIYILQVKFFIFVNILTIFVGAMRKDVLYLIFIFILTFTVSESHSQDYKRGCHYYAVIYQGDTIQAITLPYTNITGKLNRKKKIASKRSARRYTRLENAVRLTYPIAREASRMLKEMEAHIVTLKTKKEQDEYVKGVEEMLKAKYMPIVKKMSMYQGMVLLKLIDRETGKTSFKLIQELRGKFSAFFWQNITRMFGGNLKTEYDKDEEDAMIEEIVIRIQIGLL